MIMAGMQMSDKPFFVRYGYSVALDRSERFGRSGTKRVSRPLTGWRKTIERLRSEAQIQHGPGIRLVYFCPLNTSDQVGRCGRLLALTATTPLIHIPPIDHRMDCANHSTGGGGGMAHIFQ
jgi:hypothetical protein